MQNVSLPYILSYHDRHGHLRHYFRRAGMKRVTLPGRPGAPEFMLAYGAALAAYYLDRGFLALAPPTRQARRAVLEKFRSQHGDKRLRLLEQKHLVAILHPMKPFAARNWLKALRGLMQFAMAIGLRADDPTQGIKRAKVSAGTIHTWTEEQIGQFEAYHPIGSRARLAMALMLYTAARRSDAVKLGPQHIRAGRLYYRQQKTGRALSLPVHPELAAIIAATPSEHLTFVVSALGRPFTATGFSNWFRQVCDAAGLPECCSAHGLRKAAARRLAEAGCTAHEIAAITGHLTLAEVQRYTAAADQARLAGAAMERIR
jgi:integrase